MGVILVAAVLLFGLKNKDVSHVFEGHDGHDTSFSLIVLYLLYYLI